MMMDRSRRLQECISVLGIRAIYHRPKLLKIGGTKKIRFEELDELEPDFIVCNKEENNQEIVETLSKKYPVWVSDIKNIDDAFYMMRSLADILDARSEVENLLQKITLSLNQKKTTSLLSFQMRQL